MPRFLVAVFGLALPLWLACGASHAQFPSGPVRIVVPYPAGGVSDLATRALAPGLSAALGSPVVVENLPGASGLVATHKVSQSPPDGHTVLMHQGTLALYPGLIRSTSFDPLQILEPLGVFAEVPLIVVGKPGLTARSVAELARQDTPVPASPGPGSLSHVCTLMVIRAAGIAARDIVHYRGTGPALTDLMSGQTDFMCIEATGADAQIAAGRLKRLGQPEPPASNWFGLYAPKGTPPDRIARINEAIRSAARGDAVLANLQHASGTAVRDERSRPEGHRQFMQREIARWTPPAVASGSTLDMPPMNAPTAPPAAAPSHSPQGASPSGASASRGGSGVLD